MICSKTCDVAQSIEQLIKFLYKLILADDTCDC